MALLALGVGFGLTVGAGIFFLLIRPALKERAEAEAANMNSLARDKISNSCEPETDATKERQDQLSRGIFDPVSFPCQLKRTLLHNRKLLESRHHFAKV